MARVVVTGGAGFLGSHLCDRLIADGHDVVCVDNLITGDMHNLESLIGRPAFEFKHVDVSEYVHVSGPVDAVLHFASPASPPDYLEYPIQTLKVGAIGTFHMLGLAKDKGARFLLASTSEVYGDPTVSPQSEEYWGNVNPIGPRGVYDEAKRYAEALAIAYHHQHGLDVRIARIFNVYGPRLRVDGRVVSNFIYQALRGDPMTIYGDGRQTRSFCYVDDEVDGLLRLLHSDLAGRPCNIGNPNDFTILELAEVVAELTGRDLEVVAEDKPIDDPNQRKPDISLAREHLGWAPTTELRDGLMAMIEWYREMMSIGVSVVPKRHSRSVES